MLYIVDIILHISSKHSNAYVHPNQATFRQYKCEYITLKAKEFEKERNIKAGSPQIHYYLYSDSGTKVYINEASFYRANLPIYTCVHKYQMHIRAWLYKSDIQPVGILEYFVFVYAEPGEDAKLLEHDSDDMQCKMPLAEQNI